MHDVAQASRETALQTLFEAIKPGSAARFSPLLHYKWHRTAAALAVLPESAATPYDDLLLAYTNGDAGPRALP